MNYIICKLIKIVQMQGAQTLRNEAYTKVRRNEEE